MRILEHASRRRLVCLKGAVVLSLLLAACVLSPVGQARAADNPPAAFPHPFYGTIMVDDQPAPAGVTVVAKVNGIKCGSITTKYAGRYGSDEKGLFGGGITKLLVQSNSNITIENGATIEFYVETVKADQTATFESGADPTWLELTVVGPLPTPAAPSSSGPPDISWPVVGGIIGGVVLVGLAGGLLLLRRRHTQA